MKILSIIGARPQFIKSAVFRKRCDDFGIDEVLLHTGQHYDKSMSLGIFDELDVKLPDICYTLSARSHGGMTGELITKIEQTILDVKPDLVNLYGDTNTTLAGALAASKLHVPISHIEAGLRSFNKQMPEEVNRILTDHVSTYLFCPTLQSVKHLQNENITQGVYHVGDIMFDAIKMFEPKFKKPREITVSHNKKIAVLTIHRAENVTNVTTLNEIVEFCKKYSSEYQIIFPAHPNTRKILVDASIELAPIELVEPLAYLEMQGLLSEASLVLTDSGGLQKEAYFHQCECVTLRNETEWLETIDSGWNRLWKEESNYEARNSIDEYGNGDACGKIIRILSEF